MPQAQQGTVFASPHTLVFLSPVESGAYRAALVARGVNVVVERAGASTYDCSLSNYAASAGIKDYFNVEVPHADGRNKSAEAQRDIVKIIMGILKIKPSGVTAEQSNRKE